MNNIKIENNVNINELYNDKTWIHGNNTENIDITIFLITINSEQLKYSLDSINNLELSHSVIINVIMNISPTNKAYNEMRLRCKTKYFIQNDEDMELKPNALEIIYNNLENNNLENNKIFLYQYKLIDDILGVGNPPIIDCLKLYNNSIMIKFPTYKDGNITTSSVDYLWHKQILENNYKIKETKIIIGFHGKHRNNFDLMLRHCKSLKSILDPTIKTRNSHLCKILRILHSDKNNINNYFSIILTHFSLFSSINIDKLNNVIRILNSWIPKDQLKMYSIENKLEINIINDNLFDFNNFIQLFNLKNINKKQLFSIIAVLCIVTDNYEYSYDKYPIEIYNYFNDIINIKKINIIENISELRYEYSFLFSSNDDVVYDKNKKIFRINKKYYSYIKL